MSATFEESIRNSFKQFANKLYDEIIEKLNAVIEEKNAEKNVDHESYNKVSMITRQDKEIKLLKERNAELERELIAARSNNTVASAVVPVVTPVIQEPIVAAPTKKPRAKAAKKEKPVDDEVKPATTKGRKKKIVAEPVAEVVLEPVDEPVSVVVSEPVDEPVDEPVAEVVTEPVAEPVAEAPDAEVAPEPTEAPVAEVISAPVEVKKRVIVDEDVPNINDLDIFEEDGVEYYLNPVSNRIYEITKTGDLGTCIGEKDENGKLSVY